MPRWNVHFDLVINRDHRQLIEDLALIRSLSRTLREIPVPPSVQERLHRLNIVRAVRGTTGIEGIELTEEEVSDVLRSDAGSGVLPVTRQREERGKERKQFDAFRRTCSEDRSGYPAIRATGLQVSRDIDSGHRLRAQRARKVSKTGSTHSEIPTA